MVNNHTPVAPDPTSNCQPSEAVAKGPTIGGFAPSTIALIVAASCFAGLTWGAVDRNWVLVATEIPAVLALLGVWAFARANQSGHRAAVIASAIGMLCFVELWIATAVLDARGMTLAIIVAVSTGITLAAGGAWFLWSQHRAGLTVDEQ